MMKHKMILIVDEDEATIDLVERTLNISYQVLRVPDGKRAIELTKKEGIEVAIISRCLPDMEGLEVLRILTKQFPSIPVIFVADAPTKDLIISAFRSGAKDFIEKPIDPDTLLESINRVTSLIGKSHDVTHLEAKPAVPRSQKFFSFILSYRVIAAWLKRLGRFVSHFFTDSRKNGLKGGEGSSTVDRLTVASPENEITPEEQVDTTRLEEIPVGYQREEEQKEEEKQEEEQQVEDLAATLSVYCLGKFLVILTGQVIENWTSRKGRVLFMYLVMNHKTRTYRDVLMETFWPNSDLDSARNSLNVAIHSVRRMLRKVNPQHKYILFKDECYFLNPEIEIWVDVEEFLHYWKIAQSTEREKGIQAAVGEYERAAAVYKGDFMEEDLYESWPSSERENFKEIYLFILDRLSKYYSLDDKISTALSLCETILEQDNCREDIHRRLMRCYYRLGQRDKAVKQFRKCAEVLKEELEVEPTRATIELYEQIKQGFLSMEEK